MITLLFIVFIAFNYRLVKRSDIIALIFVRVLLKVSGSFAYQVRAFLQCRR